MTRSAKSTLLINLYVSFAALVTLVYGLLLPKLNRDWIIGDWLIGYQGGFVRRGFAGEFAYLLGRLLHLSPIVFCVVFYLGLYAVIFRSVRALFLSSSRKWWVLALLVSPATLAFQILHPTAGFRKELIYLAALAFLLELLRGGLVSTGWTIVYLTAALVIATLSHESLICYAPYFFAALVISGRTPGQAARICVAPFLLGAVAAYACATHLGSSQTALEICRSLGYPVVHQVNQVCSASGAIIHLSFTREMARAETVSMIDKHHYFRDYPILGLLAFLPVILGSISLWRTGVRNLLAVTWGCALLSFLCSIPLFIFAMDWGRWIYIHLFSITMLLLFLDGHQPITPASEANSSRVTNRGQKIFATVLLIAYATTWSLPHVLTESPRPGYLGFLLEALRHR